MVSATKDSHFLQNNCLVGWLWLLIFCFKLDADYIVETRFQIDGSVTAQVLFFQRTLVTSVGASTTVRLHMIVTLLLSNIS